MKELRQTIASSPLERSLQPTSLSGYVTHAELKEFHYASESYVQDATKVAKETRAANATLIGLTAPPPIIDAQAPTGSDVSTVSK